MEAVTGENLAQVLKLIDEQPTVELTGGRGKVVTLKSSQDDGHGMYKIVLSVEEYTLEGGRNMPCVPIGVLLPLFKALERFPEDPEEYGT